MSKHLMVYDAQNSECLKTILVIGASFEGEPA